MERRIAERPLPIAVPDLLGDSPEWHSLIDLLPRVAGSDLPALVLGETGSGKELVARALHAMSTRRGSGFVAHNCGATPDSLIESELFGHARGSFTGAVSDREGLFDAAHGGTLFLDEIGDASPLLQMKLLRVLQEGEARRVGETRVRRVDVRIVSATHRPLDEAVENGQFRADLYYRLNAVRVVLPALRERGRDVLVLARHFLHRAAERVGVHPPSLSREVEDLVLGHTWPGNVRELANACAYAVRVAGARGEVLAEHWPRPTRATGAGLRGLHAETRALEERRLVETLDRVRWNKSRAARSLGLSRQGLLKKLRRLGLHPREAEAAELDGPVDAA
jgi:transcriptional regulator with GAF, ATPase, and Fis domain